MTPISSPTTKPTATTGSSSLKMTSKQPEMDSGTSDRATSNSMPAKLSSAEQLSLLDGQKSVERLSAEQLMRRLHVIDCSIYGISMGVALISCNR
jgi:hypothetical protein